MVEVTGWTNIREYAKGYLRNIDGVGSATITGLKENTEYTIDVYNYASTFAGTNSLSIGNNIDSWQNNDVEQSSSEDPSVSGIIVNSDPDGKIFLKFTKVSTHIHFSGLSVSRTKEYSCDIATTGSTVTAATVMKGKNSSFYNNSDLVSGCNQFGNLLNNFAGTVSETKSGKTCQKWTSQDPHNHDNVIGDHNYCRNPDSGEGPWCYTTDPNSRWEYCDCGMLLDLNRSKLKLLKIK